MRNIGKGKFGIEITSKEDPKLNVRQWYKTEAERDSIFEYRKESYSRRVFCGVAPHKMKKITRLFG